MTTITDTTIKVRGGMSGGICGLPGRPVYEAPYTLPAWEVSRAGLSFVFRSESEAQRASFTMESLPLEYIQRTMRALSALGWHTSWIAACDQSGVIRTEAELWGVHSVEIQPAGDIFLGARCEKMRWPGGFAQPDYRSPCDRPARTLLGSQPVCAECGQ